MSKCKVVDRSGITPGQLMDFWRMVEDGTIDSRVFGYMLNNVNLLRKEALNDDFVSLTMAREIMGQNFFGPGDAEQWFGSQFTAITPTFFQQVPFSEELLREHGSDCVLIAVPKISVAEVVFLMQINSIPILANKDKNGTGFYLEGVERNVTEAGWHLLAKKPTKEISNCYCGHAQEFNSETPFRTNEVSASVLLYSTAIYFLATGRSKPLFGDKLVGSSSLSSHTNRFCVQFTPEGVRLKLEYADDCD